MLHTSASTASDRHQGRAQNQERRFDAPALPGDDDVAGAVGEPRHAERQRPDDDEEEDDADHCAGGLLSAASASAARRRLAAMAASRASAFLTHGRERAGRIRQLGDIGERGGDIAAPGVNIDARHDRAGIVARRRVDRGDADELLRIGLQPAEEGILARRRRRTPAAKPA